MEMLEQEAQNQIYDALALPFLKKLAIMPDCHKGYSLPIGGVALLDGVISPTYVGYDIGCGMCCIITNKKFNLDERQRQKVFDKIHKRIPVGVGSARIEGLDHKEFRSASGDKNLNKKVGSKLHNQLGTLGAGNHFIEVGPNKDGFISMTIHSGSRNIGHSIADFYIRRSDLESRDLPNGFLHANSDFGKAYIQDMLFAQDYALNNRKEMMLDLLYILNLPESLMKTVINENHNHAVPYGLKPESSINENLFLHRKGATPANKGQLGVIPGNMRDGVYVTKGLGNEEYLSSASHGAGRKMGRKKAKKTLDHNRFKQQMHGITCSTDKSILDEAPDAYKKIEDVLKMQVEIVVDVVDHIKPLINVKG